MADRIKAPVHKGVAKVPVVMQLEALECGAACLTMILAYYGKWIPLERVREDCGVSRDGSNARNVLRAARYYGLTAMGFRYEPDALRRQGQFPCIVHWNFNHFIVLNGFRGNKVYITDPARGACVIDMEAFDDGFTGICLQFEPNESFTPSGKPKSMAGFALRRLKGATGALVFTLVTSVIAALLGVIEPAFSRVFLDRLLTGRNPEWLMPFIVILGVFDVLRILVAALNAVFSLRISGKLAAAGNTSYMWKVLRLPMRFFSQRMAGDIQQRQGDNATIAGTLINTFAPLLIDSAMLVFYLVVMLRYSLVLTAVGLCSILIDVIVSRYISMKRVNITRVAMRDAGKLAAATSSGIGMIETIKASGAENGYFARWAGYQASVNAGEIAYQKLNSRLGMVPQLVSLLANDVVLVAGVALVMRGSFTVGMVTAFQGFLGAFMAPAMTLITAGQTLQEMRTQMERVDDVMEYPEDKVFAEGTAQDGEYTKLSGEIELRDVSFGYAPLDAPIIRDLNLTIHKGQSIAFVGASGCGKSTLANLISGMYQPWEGEIRFDGRRLSEIDKGVFRGSLAVVDQNIILFDDTIANNIRMWDDSIEDFEMILAARDAALHDDIIMRPGGYQYRLTEGGWNLSGGQRQRVEIARVLAQDPTIIILDEATSALDARTESEVVRAIRERGITCIVIAHRLSTIRSCDEIVVMEKGVIVDRGRHAQLMSRCALYNELVSAE